MQHFSNHFVQILVIRSKCGGMVQRRRKYGPEGVASPVPYFQRL